MPMLKSRRGPSAGVTGIGGIAALIVLSLTGALIQAQTAAETPSTESPQVPEWQKAAGGKLSFEVASIRPATPGQSIPRTFPLDYGDFFGVVNPHGRFVNQAPLAAYIGFAYKVWPSQELRDAMLAHSPKWVSTDEYVINAQAEGSPTKDQMRLMMQSLLAGRFKLAVHFEHKEISVLALVLNDPGKTGAKLNPHSNSLPCDVSKITSDVLLPACNLVQGISKPNNSLLISGRKLTMNQLAATLSQLSADFAHPVVDQTGLGGWFDFTLEWTRQSSNPVPPDPGTTMQEALQQQLGLKLKSTKALMDILVIDHVERPSEN